MLLTALLLVMACGGSEPERPAKVQTREESLPVYGLREPEEIVARRAELTVRLRTDPDPVVRAEIAAALAYTARDRESIPALAEALAVEKDVTVQRRLVAALASFTSQVSVDAIVGFWLRGVDPVLEDDVLGALGGADPGMVRASLEALPAGPPERVARLRLSLR